MDYGQKHSNIRCLVLGHWTKGFCHVFSGDYTSSIECSKKAIEISEDPYYSQFSKVILGMGYAKTGRFQEAEKPLREVVTYSQKFGGGQCGLPADATLGLVLIGMGHMSRGLKLVENKIQTFLEIKRKPVYAMMESSLGKVYLRIVDKSAPVTPSAMVKNIGFIIKNVPSAAKKGEAHLNKAIETAKAIGAKGILGEAYLDLGFLYKAKGEKNKARELLSKGIEVFEHCEADVFLKQAKEAMASLE